MRSSDFFSFINRLNPPRAARLRDKELFESGVKASLTNPVDMGIKNEFRAGELALPQLFQDTVPTPARFASSSSEMPPFRVGQYSPNIPKEIVHNQYFKYRDKFPDSMFGNAFHETMHSTINDLDLLRGTDLEELIKPAAQIKAYDSIVNAIDITAPSSIKAGYATKKDLYSILSEEDAARRFSSEGLHLRATPEDYGLFALHSPAITKQALERAVNYFKTKHKIIAGMAPPASRFLPAAAGIAALSQATESEAGLRGKFSGVASKVDADFNKKIVSAIKGEADIPSPEVLYRGIPTEATPETSSDKLLHATPWAGVAQRQGKFLSPSDKYTDVYEYDVLPQTEYYRGGALAGDPLEHTSINSIQGMSFTDVVKKGQEEYKRRVDKSLSELISFGLKGDELVRASEEAANTIAKELSFDVRNASFETDAFARPGIWKDANPPASLSKQRPSLRSYQGLEKELEFKRKSGLTEEEIKKSPEYKILNKTAGAAGIAALAASDSSAGGVPQRTFPDQNKTSKVDISANVPTERGEGLFSEGMEKVGRVFWDSLMKNEVKLVDPLTPDETIGVGVAAMGGGMLSFVGAAKKLASGAGTAEDVMDVVSTATGVRPGVALAKGARSAWGVLSGKKIPKLFGEDPLTK